MNLFSIDKNRPKDYHCNCEYCQKFKGVIFDPDGKLFNCRKREGYLLAGEQAHIAKTPYPIALFLIKKFTKRTEWILDPTIGIGTTAVEAKKQKRNIMGIELNPNWAFYTKQNCRRYIGKHYIVSGDVRKWKDYLHGMPKVSLIINNPPYSADNQETRQYEYDKRNLAFLGEDETYYNLIGKIYNEMGQELLLPGGHLGIGVKDMVRSQKPYLLHKYLAETIDKKIYKFVGTWILPHYPKTLFMNTYPKRFPNVKIPLYQTILCWQKK